MVVNQNHRGSQDNKKQINIQSQTLSRRHWNLLNKTKQLFDINPYQLKSTWTLAIAQMTKGFRQSCFPLSKNKSYKLWSWGSVSSPPPFFYIWSKFIGHNTVTLGHMTCSWDKHVARWWDGWHNATPMLSGTNNYNSSTVIFWELKA